MGSEVLAQQLMSQLYKNAIQKHKLSMIKRKSALLTSKHITSISSHPASVAEDEILVNKYEIGSIKNLKINVARTSTNFRKKRDISTNEKKKRNSQLS